MRGRRAGVVLLSENVAAARKIPQVKVSVLRFHAQARVHLEQGVLRHV